MWLHGATKTSPGNSSSATKLAAEQRACLKSSRRAASRANLIRVVAAPRCSAEMVAVRRPAAAARAGQGRWAVPLLVAAALAVLAAGAHAAGGASTPLFAVRFSAVARASPACEAQCAASASLSARPRCPEARSPGPAVARAPPLSSRVDHERRRHVPARRRCRPAWWACAVTCTTSWGPATALPPPPRPPRTPRRLPTWPTCSTRRAPWTCHSCSLGARVAGPR